MDQDTNMGIWEQVKTPPDWALKTIGGGRLKGMTDISPIWRYQEATRIFGPAGDGWKFVVNKIDFVNGADGQIVVFVAGDFYYKTDGEWSAPVIGYGGSMFVTQEKGGLHTNDEALKMAVTDAMSTALKLLGFGADVYANKMGGSKYAAATEGGSPAPAQKDNTMSDKQAEFITKLAKGKGMKGDEVKAFVDWVAKGLNCEARSWKVAKELLPAENFDKAFELYTAGLEK